MLTNEFVESRRMRNASNVAYRYFQVYFARGCRDENWKICDRNCNSCLTAYDDGERRAERKCEIHFRILRGRYVRAPGAISISAERT